MSHRKWVTGIEWHHCFGTLLVDEKFELDMNLTKVEDLEGTIDMSYYNEPN